MALINLNDTTPAAPAGFQNAKWQADSSSPRNVSAYLPGTGGVTVKTADYTATAADCGKLIVFNSSGAHTLTLPAASPFAQWNISIQNIGGGIVTISPNGLNIDGAGSSLALAQTQGLAISTDGTNYFSERGSSGGSQPYDVVYAYPGAQLNSTTIQLLTFPRTVAFPANFTGSYAHAGANPTSTQSFTLNRNGTSCGTVTVNTSGSFSFTTSGGSTLTFNAGDTLSITTPPSDATLSSVTITLAGTR